MNARLAVKKSLKLSLKERWRLWTPNLGATFTLIPRLFYHTDVCSHRPQTKAYKVLLPQAFVIKCMTTEIRIEELI